MQPTEGAKPEKGRVSGRPALAAGGCCHARRRAFFEGWYLKQSNGADTAAFIPAFHADAEGRRCASIQAVVNSEVYHFSFPAKAFYARRDPFAVDIGGNRFSQEGLCITLEENGHAISGRLVFGPFVPPKSDVMGPFRFVPFMQCRHGVISLTHRVEGCLRVDGKTLDFRDGTGYVETDRGVSFPRGYLWTQVNWHGQGPCCVMLSIADVPFLGGSFQGCIGIVYYGGREYRIATYRRARVLQISPAFVRVAQADLMLEAELIRTRPCPLKAPVMGGMTRVIHESTVCTVRYRFYTGGETLFDLTSDRASFEAADIGGS